MAKQDKVIGPVNRVPCPHCGRLNNMHELMASQVLEKGCEVDCDGCGRHSKVVSIDTRPRIVLRPIG